MTHAGGTAGAAMGRGGIRWLRTGGCGSGAYTGAGAAGGTPPEGNDDTFVIQEHHARSLHWDVRLERDGVLVSWAVPKGLPLNPKDNRLAVHTEDHPIDYGSFEGDIPAGEYGGGKVILWDRGRYEMEEWTDREVKVVFHGTGPRAGTSSSRPAAGTGWSTGWTVRRSRTGSRCRPASPR